LLLLHGADRPSPAQLASLPPVSQQWFKHREAWSTFHFALELRWEAQILALLRLEARAGEVAVAIQLVAVDELARAECPRARYNPNKAR
jgi:hypothetical protein